MEKINSNNVGNNVDNTVENNIEKVMNKTEISLSLTRIAYQIIEDNYPLDNSVALVGIKSGGEFVARRLQALIKDITSVDLEMGFIDIALYRDDLINVVTDPILNGTEIDFNVLGKKIVLLDDVFFTGRTIRAALDALIDFGRPKIVKLAVVVDRNCGEYPIRPDYYGKQIIIPRNKKVKMIFKEKDGEDLVFIKDK